jgi:hypothetical protein
VDPTVLDRIRALTAEGWLWPWVNRELSRAGRRADLSRTAAKRHARAASAFELQSQPWALEALAAESGARQPPSGR